MSNWERHRRTIIELVVGTGLLTSLFALYDGYRSREITILKHEHEITKFKHKLEFDKDRKLYAELDRVEKVFALTKIICVSNNKLETKRNLKIINELFQELSLRFTIEFCQTYNNKFDGTFILPLQNRRLTSSFGKRIHPITGDVRYHNGIDFSAPRGTKVKSSASGKVVYSDWKGAYGKTILIDHGQGFKTQFSQLDKINVHVGQIIKAGEFIGEVGSTGRSTGAHLHFEIIKNGKAVNPLNYLPK